MHRPSFTAVLLLKVMAYGIEKNTGKLRTSNLCTHMMHADMQVQLICETQYNPFISITQYEPLEQVLIQHAPLDYQATQPKGFESFLSPMGTDK